MSSEFEAEIKKLAQNYSQKTPESEVDTKISEPELTAVLKEFHSVSQKGADTFNEAQSGDVFRVYDLPADFLEIFLGIPGSKGGLAVVSQTKLAVLFGEEPGLITVIGKIRNNKRGMHPDLNKSLKLIQLSYFRSNTGFEYKDNTGKTVDPGEIITVILSWLVQP